MTSEPVSPEPVSLDTEPVGTPLPVASDPQAGAPAAEANTPATEPPVSSGGAAAEPAQPVSVWSPPAAQPSPPPVEDPAPTIAEPAAAAAEPDDAASQPAAEQLLPSEVEPETARPSDSDEEVWDAEFVEDLPVPAVQPVAESDAAGPSAETPHSTDVPVQAPTQAPGEPVRSRGLVVLTSVLGVLVVLAAVGLGLSLKYEHDRTEPARERSAAQQAAGRIVADLNTLDYRNVPAWETKMQADSTGGLRDDFASKADEIKQAVTGTQSVTVGVVASSAYCGGQCTTAQVAGNTANALVYAKTTVKSQARPAGDLIYDRYTVKLAKVNGVWLATTIDPVAATASS